MKVLRWIGIVFGSLLGLVVVAALVLFFIGNSRLEKSYAIPVKAVAIPTDAASLELGKHRVVTLCAGCHGADLGGIVNWFDGGPLGSIDTANLTAGEGGIGREYQSVDDYVRAIRHGVDPDGKPIYMPAVIAFTHMSDDELGAVIAYLQTLPPVDRQLNGHRLTPLAKILLAAGAFGKLPVEAVDHAAQPKAVPAGATVAYGEYLVNISDCKTCHGPQLTGGKHPDPTIKTLVPDISPASEVGGWTAEQFINTIRTGFNPAKKPLSNELMPWKEYALDTDEELTAMYLYLQSLPKTPAASQ